MPKPHAKADPVSRAKRPSRVRVAPGCVLAGGRLLYFLGPCVIESERMLARHARKIGAVASGLGIPWVLKASYDKANRSSGTSFRGPGLEAGCRVLARAGADLGVPVMTDVHSPEEAVAAAEWIDVLQIPAFLCRQTDLVVAAVRTGRAVNIKKGQFLSPQEVTNIAGKIEGIPDARFFFTERGTTFGYNQLVVDMRSLPIIRALGYPVVFDATHSVQRPGGGGDHTSGDGPLVPALARAAVAAGCDGVFMEVHENPAAALSDGPNQLPLRDLRRVLETLEAIDEVVR
jgi:2-dehydro-3-deoxyphosphooctonate aldolase (KDO 8-P synthase)